MDNNTTTELLKNFRSYKFAVMNLQDEGCELSTSGLTIYSDRKPRFISRYDKSYDYARYTRIVEMVESAINYVLNDDQRSIIMRKYIDRNTMGLSEIATALHKDRTTVGRWHKEAINKLAKSLFPIEDDYMEITNVDHMFDAEWMFKEPA